MASSSKSASTSASTSTADGNTYYAFDVFLNHRGSDGKMFASHLYDRLTDHGLRVFLDREEMEKGEELTAQIEGAIRASSVNIAIFSPQYCQSHWCLKEVLLMLECKGTKETKGSTILPIFFHVEPSVLRWTDGEKGVYGEALSSLQKKRNRDGQLRYKPEIIGEWKKALHDVAEISGYELDGKSSYNGDESKLLTDVVEKVLKLVPKPPPNVCKYPTGLKEKVKDFEEKVLLQQHESGKAKVVGIVGLGGIGKTTLAKEFYNREKEKYRRSSFVSDVRENNSRGQLKNLQRQLIKELSGKDKEIYSTDLGISLLQECLPRCHALIILDDVDDIGQLRALLPVLPAKDSLILVTSRDKTVLPIWELIEDPFIYTLEGLSLQHSVELFCWHAFHQPGPPDAVFEHLVNKFVDACGKLPLSLCVIGALLRGKKQPKHWEEQLRKIPKTLPMEWEWSYNGDESKLLKDVVEKALKLVPKPPLDVSIYPTGLEEPEELEEPDELEEPEESEELEEEPEEPEELELSELESEEEEEPEELEEPDELEEPEGSEELEEEPEEPEELEELSGLERLESLEYLQICGCRGLKRIHGLAQLTELQTLVVQWNRDLEELPGIEGSQSLKEVRVFDCPKLKREYKEFIENL